MKVTLTMVMSVDGKITQGDDSNIYTWTSAEDQEHFSEMKNQSDVIIMGSETYHSAKAVMKLQPGLLRVVLTRQPKKYQEEAVIGQLEFSSEEPTELLERLKAEGKQKVLLVGGSVINALFFTEGLVDEVFVSVEPKLFGKGKPLIADSISSTSLQLLSYKQLNTQGTLLLHFKVSK